MKGTALLPWGTSCLYQLLDYLCEFLLLIKPSSLYLFFPLTLPSLLAVPSSESATPLSCGLFHLLPLAKAILYFLCFSMVDCKLFQRGAIKTAQQAQGQARPEAIPYPEHNFHLLLFLLRTSVSSAARTRLYEAQAAFTYYQIKFKRTNGIL